MNCYYCKNKMKASPVDICENCFFHLNDSDDYFEYSKDDVDNDIKSVMNKTGVTPARFID